MVRLVHLDMCAKKQLQRVKGNCMFVMHMARLRNASLSRSQGIVFRLLWKVGVWMADWVKLAESTHI